MNMNKDQQEAISKARAAAIALKSQADKARSLGLPVLEQWLRDASVGCQAGADFQVRAMGDNLQNQTERVVVDRLPATCEKCGHGLHGPVCSYAGPDDQKLPSGRSCDCDWNPHNAQANATADTLKRRGLLP